MQNFYKIKGIFLRHLLCNCSVVTPETLLSETWSRLPTEPGETTAADHLIKVTVPPEWILDSSSPSVTAQEVFERVTLTQADFTRRSRTKLPFSV